MKDSAPVSLALEPESVVAPALAWGWRALMLADVFESVRLNQQGGDDFARRWIAFVEEVRREVLPHRNGRWIKSTGDGFLIEFDAAAPAAAVALDVQRRVARYNQGRPAQQWIMLRIGLHAGEVALGEFDRFGAVVDLTQRLSTLARPGETIVSDEISSRLIADVDGDLEDLGDCFLKGLNDSVRAHRLGLPAEHAGLAPVDERRNAALRPVIAVLPLPCHLGSDPGDAFGQALTEEIILHLSRVAELDVINGNSTRRLHRRALAEGEASLRLDADLLLCGSYRVAASRMVLTLQLQDGRRGTVLFAEQYETSVAEAFDPDEPLAPRIVLDTAKALFRHAFALTNGAPLLAVESYALLFSAIGLMHRATVRDFDRAREMLQHLVARQGRYGIAEAWLAKWHVLRVVQGWSADPLAEQREALDHVHRSLDLNPSNALALSIGGLVHAYLIKDLTTAGRMYQAALDDNPSEPLAWLFSATRHAYLGEGPQAEAAGEKALRLSPIDPLRYFFESLAATAAAGNSHWRRSIELSRRSIKSNRTHASTWRTLVFALVQDGAHDEARQATTELMRIEPGLTVSGFRTRFPGRDGPMAEPWAQALLTAGVPAAASAAMN
jgi:adenylate cyclase